MKNKLILIAKAVLFSTLFVSHNFSFAQAGSLDLSFDNDGIVTTPNASTIVAANSVAIQADGKIVVAGYSYNGTNTDFILTRYNTNGSLDLSFDTDGIVTTPIGTNNDYGLCVAIQADGKIVVAGESDNGFNSAFALTRYNTDGSLDLSFDTDGKVTTQINIGSDGGWSIAIQADGKIVVAGVSGDGANQDFALARYNTDGSLDLSFDNDGIVTTPVGIVIGGSGDWGLSLAIQTDGKIVVAGYAYISTNHDFALARYNTNGSLDLSFDSDGIVTTPIGSNQDYGRSVAIQADGKIVLAGWSYTGTNFDFALTRYNTNGSLDLSFDTDGIATTPIGSGHDWGYSVAIQTDGKIVVAGTSNNGTDDDFALARYNTNGSLDLSFDSDGIVTTPIGSGNDWGRSLALQADGKIVVAGTSDYFGTGAFTVVRYNNNISNVLPPELSENVKHLSIYPNPFSSTTTLKTDLLLKNATLTVYSLLGEQIAQIENLSGLTITLNRHNLPSGIYFIRLTQDNKILSRNKLVITD